MLQNAYFLAKIGADTAENEQHFAEILPIGRRGASRRPSTPCGGTSRRLWARGAAPLGTRGGYTVDFRGESPGRIHGARFG